MYNEAALPGFPAREDSLASLTGSTERVAAAVAATPPSHQHIDIKDSGVRGATLHFGKGGKGPAYRHYAIALAMTECNEYHKSIERAMLSLKSGHAGAESSGSSAVVLYGGLKGNSRGNAKASQYTAEGKAGPAHRHIKDYLRSTVLVVGHEGVEATETALETEFGTPFERKNRLSSPTHDIVCVYRLASGMLVEVQISYTSVNALKSYAHVLYEYARADTAGSLALERATCLGSLTDKGRAAVKDDFGVYYRGYDDINPEDIIMPWI